ncbi:unnamed protein product [Cyprideis torosa]|uniref:Uncharacterized protein n=1 Tax=Cyprideis torosa TaxID=163714 RepID=A0A7R8ZJG4_9CRUS|nr:unnamed protein product [Cyprideis torosa]CAG0886907.1 unnamed protein product [Cyprideis torosa]
MASPAKAMISKEAFKQGAKSGIWSRNCEKETRAAVGNISGTIPKWLSGKLVRNGPGRRKFGTMEMKHLFDGMALLHAFTFHEGQVTYDSRFVQSNSFRKNKATNRIVVDEFGTRAVPDPCKNIFQRYFTYLFPLGPGNNSELDNTLVNVTQIGDEIYAMTETANLNKIDLQTLDTLERVKLPAQLAVSHATAHPHMDEKGNNLNMGNGTVDSGGPGYYVVEFPRERSWDAARVLAKIPARWKFYPSYYHSFGMTDQYFVFLEQPLTYNVFRLLTMGLCNRTISQCFKWWPKEKSASPSSPTIPFIRSSHSLPCVLPCPHLTLSLHVPSFFSLTAVLTASIATFMSTVSKPSAISIAMALFHLVERSSGRVLPTRYEAEPVFVFHHINAYEEEGYVHVDVCAYDDGAVIEGLTQEKIKQNDIPRAHCRRYSLPIPDSSTDEHKQVKLGFGRKLGESNLELPRINYSRNGKQYRFVYGVSTDTIKTNEEEGEKEYFVTKLVKVDVESGEEAFFVEPNCDLSEPVFVANPEGKEEDDGVILSAIMDHYEERRTGIVILNAADMSEIGRASFQTEDSVTMTFHGMFFDKNVASATY